MGNVSIHAGHAPCRGCGKAAPRMPVQRMATGRAFDAAGGEAAESVPAPGFGHDFAKVAVSRGEPDEEG